MGLSGENKKNMTLCKSQTIVMKNRLPETNNSFKPPITLREVFYFYLEDKKSKNKKL